MTDLQPVHRRPRLLVAPPADLAFELPAVPQLDRPQRPNVTMVFVPVLTTAGILAFGIISRQFYLIMLGALVTVAAIATPVLMYLGNRKAAKRRNVRRRERYEALIARTDVTVRQTRERIRESIEWRHPTPDTLGDWIEGGRLWERRATDDDFLTVALGLADVPSGVGFVVGRVDMIDAEALPGLEDRAAELRRLAMTLDDAPLGLDLREAAVVGVEGDREQALALATAMLLEAVVCCGPDELSLLVAAPEPSAGRWAWAARVPHAVHRGEPNLPQVATDAEQLGTALARVVAPRLRLLDERDLPTTGNGLTHLLVVLDLFHPLSELQEVPLLQQLLSRAAELGATVLAIAESPGGSPAESVVTITVNRRDAVLQPSRSTRATTRFTPIGAGGTVSAAIGAALAGRLLVSDMSFAGESGNDVLLDLIDARQALLAPVRWDDLPPERLLTVTFGRLSDGHPFTLDLKESAAGGSGPHGLLVGATGSGKSELLRSLITSLALTHGPDTLQMAFVDFKGGAAFDLLASLPHCTGLITNILDDPSLIERMRTALTGELMNRQRQLAAAGRDVQDIRQYRLLRKRQPDLPPMPYLLLVIDEFAELLESDPKFLDLLLSIGRQGRSLGIHLILSSQRLESGRIRGLESYLSYRIALRTFNADESSVAIGSKAAADLPPLPGHGYFRTGATLLRFRGSQVSLAEADGQSDLSRVVDWLRDVPRSALLWLSPLPNAVRMELLVLGDHRLRASGHTDVRVGLPVVVGLLDEPLKRRQDVFVLDPAVRGGHVALIGAPQSGRSSALAAHIVQAARTHPAYLLQFLILDFGGGRLAPLMNLPNVAAYATPQEPHRVARILSEVLTGLDERAQEFRRHGITSMEQRRVQAVDAAGNPLQAHTVLVIDNYAAFKERRPEYDATIERMLIEGASFGLHLQVASSRWTDISPRKLEQITTRVELRLNEPGDSQFGRSKAAILAGGGPGRALTGAGAEVQLALPFLRAGSGSGAGLADVVEEVSREAASRWRGDRAAPLSLLDDLTADGFVRAEQAARDAGSLLVGVTEAGFRPAMFNPGADGHLMMFGDPGSGRTSTLRRLVRSVGALADLYVVDFRGVLAGAVPTVSFADSTAGLKDLVGELRKELEARMTGPPDRPILLVVDDYELVQALSPPTPNDSLPGLSGYLLVSQRLRFSVVVNQLAANSFTRGMDPFIKRALEAGAVRLHFSMANRTEQLPGGGRGQSLPGGVAHLLRPSRPELLVRTVLPPSG